MKNQTQKFHSNDVIQVSEKAFHSQTIFLAFFVPLIDLQKLKCSGKLFQNFITM